jgi:hypothetical protein
MPVHEIPRAQWVDFCDSFSRQHRGGRVTIEVVPPGERPRVEARELPLQGLTADLGKSGTDAISVRAGQDDNGHVTHTSTHVRHLRFQETDAGAQEGIEIETQDGTLTRVRFRVPVLPEMLDGVVL